MTHPDPAPRALRLDLAFDAGLALPDGRVGLMHWGGLDALPDLPRDRLLAITPHAADHAHLAAQGVDAQAHDPAPGSLAAVIVALPRARAEGADLIARACGLTAGPVVVDGQKTDGVEGMLRALAPRVALSPALSKGHGKIAWFASAPLDDWRAAPATVVAPDGVRFQTLPGVFSADGVDPASDLLAQALPANAGGVAVDLGAGWGYLAQRLLARAPGIRALHLVDADARALDCARVNVTDPRAVFHWADATRPLPGIKADLVVMNPPFHRARAADPSLGLAFIATAAALLTPGGALWMVANRHLPYEAALTAAFARIEDAGGTAQFKLFRASHPKRATPAAARQRIRA